MVRQLRKPLADALISLGVAGRFRQTRPARSLAALNVSEMLVVPTIQKLADFGEVEELHLRRHATHRINGPSHDWLRKRR